MIPMDDEMSELAHSLVSANRYLTLGTVDPVGRPWTSPVYFSADDGLRHFVWVSSPTAQHSRNLAARPEVSFVVFDSTVPPYHGRSVYGAGRAAELHGKDLERGLVIYPGPSSRGGSPVTLADVTGAAPWRLYGAELSKLWVLCPREPRQPCPRHGRSDDHRCRVW
jgi:hypothetical protein